MITTTNIKRPWENSRSKPQGFRKEHDSFYDSPIWRRTRKSFLQKNPLCSDCEAEGLTTAAQVCDHKVPRKDGGADYDEKNLQGLCYSHHAKKSSLERKNIKGRAV